MLMLTPPFQSGNLPTGHAALGDHLHATNYPHDTQQLFRPAAWCSAGDVVFQLGAPADEVYIMERGQGEPDISIYSLWLG